MTPAASEAQANVPRATITKTRWLHMHNMLSFHLIHQIAQPLHARDTNIANWFVRPPLNSSLLTLALHKPQSRAVVQGRARRRIMSVFRNGCKNRPGWRFDQRDYAVSCMRIRVR